MLETMTLRHFLNRTRANPPRAYNAARALRLAFC